MIIVRLRGGYLGAWRALSAFIAGQFSVGKFGVPELEKRRWPMLAVHRERCERRKSFAIRQQFFAPPPKT
jgi:hypothetical protein